MKKRLKTRVLIMAMAFIGGMVGAKKTALAKAHPASIVL